MRVLLIFLLAVSVAACNQPPAAELNASQTPTARPDARATATATATVSATLRATLVPTPTAHPSPTAASAPTTTPSPTLYPNPYGQRQEIASPDGKWMAALDTRVGSLELKNRAGKVFPIFPPGSQTACPEWNEG